jgi:flagellar protein FlaF
MGFSVAASSAIIFIGFLFAAGILLTSMTIVIDDLKDDMDKYSEKLETQGATHFSIENATNSSTTIFMNLTNTGATTLKVNELEILVNGSIVTPQVSHTSVEGNTNTNLWAPEESLYLEVQSSTNTGERVLVISGSTRDFTTVT